MQKVNEELAFLLKINFSDKTTIPIF